MSIENQMSTKEQIVNAGIQLMKERGVQKTFVDDICERAQISKTTFYYHFKSKNDLVSNFFININQPIHEHLAEILSASDYVNQLWICNALYLEYLSSLGAELTRELYITNLRKDAKILAPDDIYLKEVMLVLIAKGQEAGQIKNSVNPHLLFDALLTLTNGAVFIWAMKNGNYDLNAHTKEMYLTLLQCSPEPNASVEEVSDFT